MSYPIWLLADSEPDKWRAELNYPLDHKHPTRHNIWTPILDVIQEEVFMHLSNRIKSDFFIRNAVSSSSMKVDSVDWSEKVNEEINLYRDLVNEYKPRLILSFGQFAYEFAKRATCEEPSRCYSYWSIQNLAKNFREKSNGFDKNKVNVLPLLHEIVALQFLYSHMTFCFDKESNYFVYVGKEIANILLPQMTVGFIKPLVILTFRASDVSL